MFNEPKPLLVVYKEQDEMILNQLKKLVDTKDDSDDGNIIGTEDGTVKIVAWNEKTWIQNKKAGNTGDLADKILFIGKIKGTDKLEPVLDIMFDEYGVKYGVAGNQALLIANPMKIRKSEDYEAFLKELKKVTDLAIAKKEKKEKNWKILAKSFIPYLGPVWVSKEIMDNNKIAREQQLFYGITKLYLNDLDAFMKA